MADEGSGPPELEPLDIDLSDWPPDVRRAFMAEVAAQHIGYRLDGDVLRVPDADSDRAIELVAWFRHGEGGRSGVDPAFADLALGLVGGTVATRGARIAGFVLDWVILRIMVAAAVLAFGGSSTLTLGLALAVGTTYGLLVVLLPMALWRGSIGMLVVGTRVVVHRSLAEAPLGTVLLRWVVPFVLTVLGAGQPNWTALVLLAVYVPVLVRSDHRGGHDLLAGTTVVGIGRR